MLPHLREQDVGQEFLESVEVCAAGSYGTFGALSKKKIRLANFPNNTVSVKITRWEDLYASFYNYRCKFQVTAPKNMGVMVVIQSMKMRTRKRISCRDYIQFQQDDGVKSGQICGTVDATDSSKVPERSIGPRQFHDPKGALDVTFFTDARDDDEDEDPIALHLIFTAYRECTPTLINSNVVKQCSSLRSHSCISSQLFCDGVINCGFNDEDFGADEQNCGAVQPRDSDEVDRSISIYVFAITTVATLVIVVILSLIVCCCLRKFAKQRRSGDMYTQNGGSPLHHHSQHLHHHNQQTGFGPDIIRLDTTGPTAPLRSTEPSPEKFPVVDIDQPPPYDALFPSAKPAWQKSTSKKQ
ncbi:hypothetical protein Ocin01_01574 [Orchesella cincta]|uniref:CUB domain-containing protein n=1 Tax=Orchesella cincta TaxID=48709 RepID=A0A1D2NII7_ORCCI|nr:hypothetical protein Ocin01_01574 [Orchesella cincta]